MIFHYLLLKIKMRGKSMSCQKPSKTFIFFLFVIQVEGANRKYILTQGPLPQTTSHFWLMIWEQNCQAIVMLNRIMEKNVVSKCFNTSNFITCIPHVFIYI